MTFFTWLSLDAYIIIMQTTTLRQSPEPLVQIQNNFTELFLAMPSNGSAPLNKGTVRALDENCLLKTFRPEPLVQIQNNFT